jgi:hypothetical protein
MSTPEEKKNTRKRKTLSSKDLPSDYEMLVSKQRCHHHVLPDAGDDSHGAQRKQGSTKNETEQRQLTEFPSNQHLRLGVLPIKKGLKCFQANENVCGFCLLNY